MEFRPERSSILIWKVMLANKLDWRKFTALERSLLAFSLKEWIAIGSLTIKVSIVPQSFLVSLSA